MEKGMEFKIERIERPSVEKVNYEVFQRELREQLEAAVQGFAFADSTRDLARANDLVLRLDLGRPKELLAGEADKSFYPKLMSYMGDIANECDIHGGHQREIRDEFALLEYSVKQLSQYVRERWMKDKEAVLATSPELDVSKGVDLIDISPVFDETDKSLLLNMTLIQAKAKRGGLSVAEVRDLPREFGKTMREGAYELMRSPERIYEQVLREDFEIPKLSKDRVLDMISKDSELDEFKQKFLEGKAPVESFSFWLEHAQRVNGIFSYFGDELQEVPEISFGEVDYRYLIETANGNAVLSIKEALKYKE